MEKIKDIVIIGAGPAGLMAAEVLASVCHHVAVYDRMPSVGRKFLMAGRGGLNLTHSEPLERFVTRYHETESWLAPYIKSFTPDDLRRWCESLGQETFIGSSGRIFPKAMKAAPLLRAWLNRLNGSGVKFHLKHNWLGWQHDKLKFTDAEGKEILVTADATMLALGGASWPRLGSDGSWMNILKEQGLDISPLRPSNCGFETNWSKYFSDKFAGTPLKSVAVMHEEHSRKGELMITKTGIEGGAIYAISSSLREAIIKHKMAVLRLDLSPNLSIDALSQKLAAPRGDKSLSTYLKRLGFSSVAISLLYETNSKDKITQATPCELAKLIKSVPIMLTATSGITRAISSAGGIKRSELDEHFMLVKKPNVYAIGEMLDWEAPTGGYLLQACFSTAVAAAKNL